MDTSNIPGMIEYSEQKKLDEVIKDIDFTGTDVAIEYGAFFGRSTKIILNSLEKNNSFNLKNIFLVYDSFECNVNGFFARSVYQFARKGNVENLINVDKNIINFRNIFNHYILPTSINLKINQLKLSQIKPIKNNIAFMHIDAPKFYTELKYILLTHFQNLKVGSIIIFQDFFYHWSATLIASVSFFLQSQILSIKGSAASSLYVVVQRKIYKSDLEKLDHLITSDTNYVNNAIDEAIRIIVNLNPEIIDRIHNFLPRLILARIQHSFSLNDFRNASKEWQQFLLKYPVKEQSVFDDFFDLFYYGFSIREIFELDYSNS